MKSSFLGNSLQLPKFICKIIIPFQISYIVGKNFIHLQILNKSAHQFDSDWNQQEIQKRSFY